MNKIIRVRNWTINPKQAYIEDGPDSGEEYLKTCLLPMFRDREVTRVTIDLDGCIGFSVGFLIAAFGDLAVELGAHISDKIIFVSNDRPYLIQEITWLMKGGAR